MAWIDNLMQRESAPVLEAGMGFAYQRQLVIANNIANVETPYYKRQTLPEDEFKEAMIEAINERGQYHPTELRLEEKMDLTWNGSYPKMRMFNGIENTLERHDENSISLEQEMANQAKNQLKMSAMQQLYKKTMDMMLNAATQAK